MMACVAALFACVADSAAPWIVPTHVLLLPWRLLQCVLERSAVLYGGGTPQELLGRELVSADSAEHSSLHVVHLGLCADDPCIRCLAGHVVYRPGNGKYLVRDPRGHARARHKCHPAQRLSIWLSLPATCGRGL